MIFGEIVVSFSFAYSLAQWGTKHEHFEACIFGYIDIRSKGLATGFFGYRSFFRESLGVSTY